MLTPFEVLALPARRQILDRLRDGARLVGDLADDLAMSQPAVSKQLKVLREAGFVQVRVDAQRRWYELRPEPLADLADWLEPYRWMWADRLDRLSAHLDEMPDDLPENGEIR